MRGDTGEKKGDIKIEGTLKRRERDKKEVKRRGERKDVVGICASRCAKAAVSSFEILRAAT